MKNKRTSVLLWKQLVRRFSFATLVRVSLNSAVDPGTERERDFFAKKLHGFWELRTSTVNSCTQKSPPQNQTKTTRGGGTVVIHRTSMVHVNFSNWRIETTNIWKTFFLGSRFFFFCFVLFSCFKIFLLSKIWERHVITWKPWATLWHWECKSDLDKQLKPRVFLAPHLRIWKSSAE